MTGTLRVLSSATYSAPSRPGSAKSSWSVPHCQTRPIESFSGGYRMRAKLLKMLEIKLEEEDQQVEQDL
jgi:ATPase subunit of ABC transporter with duplicated ATPase domains